MTHSVQAAAELDAILADGNNNISEKTRKEITRLQAKAHEVQRARQVGTGRSQIYVLGNSDLGEEVAITYSNRRWNG